MDYLYPILLVIAFLGLCASLCVCFSLLLRARDESNVRLCKGFEDAMKGAMAVSADARQVKIIENDAKSMEIRLTDLRNKEMETRRTLGIPPRDPAPEDMIAVQTPSPD